MKDPNCYGGRGTPEELLAFQRLAWSSMVLSMTRRCPLSCAHCITSSRPDFPGPRVSRARARRWAAELPALAGAGLRQITFTGGEPILALPAVELLAEACRDAGIHTAVVTSGAWAEDARAGARIASRLGAVSHWDIGYDPFHAAGLAQACFQNAIQILSEANAPFSIRVCRIRDEDRQRAFLSRLREMVGPEIRIILQPVRGLGRAAKGGAKERQSAVPAGPCMATGPFVREDGSVGPCCAGLAYEARDSSPFVYGNVDETGLFPSWRRWRSDPLLRLMRMTGLGIPLQWLREAGLKNGFSDDPPDICETCVRIWREIPNAAEYLRERAAKPGVRSQLDRLESHLYGRIWKETPF